MPIVRVDGKPVGYADVSGETVIQMCMDEGWSLGLEPGEHEITIELEPEIKETKDGDVNVVFRRLSSKFEIPSSLFGKKADD